MELHLITWSEMAYREKKKDEEKDWPKLGREISQLGSSEICGFGQHKAAADIWACGFYDKCYPALYANHTMEKRSVAPNSSSKVFLSRKEKKVVRSPASLRIMVILDVSVPLYVLCM